jgi:hypothetical protein
MTPPDVGQALSAGAQGIGAVSSVLSAIPALGPQSGLQVVPVTFQAVEQEGRWKPAVFVAASSPGRIFELQAIAPQTGQVPTSNPGTQAFWNSATTPEYWGTLSQCQANLFTITCGQASFMVDATWWADGLEIWGGYAGLATATGFGSVMADMAYVSLSAIPFGNYFPAAVLVTWSGWVNPVGPPFWEFRGAVVLGADGSISASGGLGANVPTADMPGPAATGKGQPLSAMPNYMTYWGRESGSTPTGLNWTSSSGFPLQASGTSS